VQMRETRAVGCFIERKMSHLSGRDHCPGLIPALYSRPPVRMAKT
jgi:hypothetical protein